MALKTRGGRLGAVAEHGARAAVIIGAAFWLCRRRDRQLAEPERGGIVTAICDLTSAHGRLAATVDRRLRSLEESTARAEAEMRFMATLIGEPHGVRPRQQTKTSRADRAERPHRTSERMGLRASDPGAEGATA